MIWWLLALSWFGIALFWMLVVMGGAERRPAAPVDELEPGEVGGIVLAFHPRRFL